MAEVAGDGVCLADLLEVWWVGSVGDGDDVPVVQTGRVGGGLILIYLAEAEIGFWPE